MNLIRFALRKPVSIMVMVMGLLFFGIKATKEVQVDILPEMNLPVVYIAHSFHGYTPQQMEGYFTKMYVNMMLFANGIKSIETKNTQGLTLMKINFYEGTNNGRSYCLHQCAIQPFAGIPAARSASSVYYSF
ncbi:efflux RND transporter permease subunit [Sphingobacterium spiritivorum]|uniref:efflux RND transporter permease subunit n=1 Tax=Sphingobacterium spiritivorum TaxID=258 RepID=UPI0029347B6E|nr:efflux RND transporter permease subunit [Sphingobacterium spiritivorum]